MRVPVDDSVKQSAPAPKRSTKSRNRRSKVYINVLKIRLMQRFPSACKPLVRNEADVRLATGVWHAAGTLRWVAGIGIVLVGAAHFIAHDGGGLHALFGEHYSAITGVAVVMWLAFYFRSRIAEFLHYQRMREVVYVLDTAYFCFRDRPDLLDPPFDEFHDYMQQNPLAGPSGMGEAQARLRARNRGRARLNRAS